ncbi:hypothetical protein F4820DRAFT_441025 [Hypoxylon rubiginosum]|uniref:Uncharacterized protein n=1 Tax=Hypoxylon rubiginosum TaxID=110542 RepID=A0ACB9YIR5_9PEZI|nr:hypothetical protein F4820DRAFT_441025 [Hypoxylon rubiginosum]
MRFTNLSVLFLALATSGITNAAPTGDKLEVRATWATMSVDQATLIYGLNDYRRFNGLNRNISGDQQTQAFAWVKDTLFQNQDTGGIERDYKAHRNWRPRLPAADETQQAYNILGLGIAPT